MAGKTKEPTGEELPVLDLRRVNRFLLFKQHLTDDSRGGSGDIVRIAGDIGGLHATSAITPYLSLFARVKDFRREQLDEELYSSRTMGKVRGVRGTVYVHPRDALHIVSASNRRMNIPNSELYYRYMDRTEEEYEKLSRRILRLLRGRGLTAAEIKKELDEEKSVSPVVNLMCDHGLLIRGAPAGGWRSNAHTYYLFEEYMPGIDLAAVDEAEARRGMVRRYLAAFGPASVGDISWWTAFRVGEVGKVLESMGDDVRRVCIDGMEKVYYMLASEVAASQETTSPRRPAVNLLPYLDPYLMAYKERDRYLSPRYSPYIYDRGGNATNSILNDGRIVGVWDCGDRPPTLKYFLFEEFSKQSRQALARQALRLGAFLAGEKVGLEECGDMTPLAERTAGGFMTPLKN